jgi:predicted RNase H-like HicB family nuclease
MNRYTGILCKDDGSSYGIHFPDLPGCAAAGETEDEVLANAAVALRLWTEGMAVLPAASTFDTLRKRPDVMQDLAEGGCAVLIPLIKFGRKQRLNVMLEPDVVAATDQAAKAAGVSRSAYIEQAVAGRLTEDLGAATTFPATGKVRRR